MEDNQGFKFLKEAFAKFAGKYSGADVAGRAVRSVAAGGKAAVDRGLQEFPKAFVNQLAKDVYGLLTSQELADGISATVRSLDEEKAKELVDGIVNNMKDRDTALNVAKKIKDALAKYSAADLTDQIDGLMDLGNVPMQGRFVLQVLLGQIKPVLDGMKNNTEEEIADKIMALADNIPSDMIAQQVANITKDVTPERVSKQANDLVGKLPSPQAISDIVHGVGTAASEHLDRIANVAAPDEVPSILRELGAAANDIVSETISKDNAAKKSFPKKGGKFDF